MEYRRLLHGGEGEHVQRGTLDLQHSAKGTSAVGVDSVDGCELALIRIIHHDAHGVVVEAFELASQLHGLRLRAARQRHDGQQEGE